MLLCYNNHIENCAKTKHTSMQLNKMHSVDE